MGVRPARCYTKAKGPAYTRTQGRKNKGYIRGIPGSKIVMYDMGDKSGKFEVEAHLIAKERCTIRHMAIEAARQAINRKAQVVGRDQYHFRVRVHPYHVLRENKMMAFAGADRMQDGMRLSFGKPTDLAARVNKNQELFTVSMGAKNYKIAIAALKAGVAKMPCPATVVIGKGKELIPRH